MATSMFPIRTESLTKNFGALTAVDRLTLSVEEGEIFGLVGPDGAGKTTAMRLLTAILEPTSGEAWIAGRHLVKEAEAIKDDIGYMSQRFGLYADLTVIENLDFYADIYQVPRKDRAEKIERLLAFSHLAPFKKRQAGHLSGGMKQKLGLACALIHTPKVLFLDEPTNGVDPVSRRDFWRILYQLLREKVTIFVSTAYLDEAERCNRVALIHQGKVMTVGTPDTVKKLMHGTLLEIRSTNPRLAAALLREKMPPGAVGLFGDRVHVVSRSPDLAAQQAERVLAQAGLRVEAIRTIEPGLEDVFVSVLGGARTVTSASCDLGLRTGGSEDPRSNDAALHFSGETDVTAISAVNFAVSVENLERCFGSFIAVNRISFQVAKGEIFGFLGPNGAGKSTTIRMLCGLLAPSGGEGTVAGFDIRRQQERIKANIGYMSQKFSLYEDLTVEENIDFYSGIYRIAPDKKRARKEWVIEMAGLKEHRRSKTGILSGGWKQRLALGCAILHEPPILFLDEPTSGVDPISRRQFWELIYELSGKGVTVFVTTHYMDEAEYCDRIGLIYRGELIASGSPAALKTLFMHEAVLEIRCDRPQDARVEIERVPGIKEVALFGKGLHAVALDAAAATLATRQRLAARGFAVIRIERIDPSLEDVFVSLIEAHDQGEEQQTSVKALKG